MAIIAVPVDNSSHCAAEKLSITVMSKMTSAKHLLVLDEGTTSTRAIIMDVEGQILGSEARPLTQHYPAPGLVEHDAEEIWAQTLACARSVINRVEGDYGSGVADGADGAEGADGVGGAGGVGGGGGAHNIAAIGITNQRETVVAWDKNTGQALAPALVWQDRRTADYCAQLREEGLEEGIQRKTGLLLDPYFSGTKMRWLLRNAPEVQAAAERGTLALGTVESWLVFKLTGGAHISDASNASRTLLMGLQDSGFDPGLCDAFDVPHKCLGEVVDTCGDFGAVLPEFFGAPIGIHALIGDQQSATIGQGCLMVGEAKATYGTGAFILANHGEKPPQSGNRLLATVLHQMQGKRIYALEGSVFVAGSLVQWLRDSLGLLGDASETERLARSIPNNGGVVIVPAMSGLGAPHWRPDARGAIGGLSFASGRAEIARAALEAMAHQTHDLAQAFAQDGADWSRLKIDGGMSANDWMAQDIANILNIPIERPDNVETTALGAAILAACGAGLYPQLRGANGASARMRGAVKEFEPDMEAAERAHRLGQWRAALARV